MVLVPLAFGCLIVAAEPGPSASEADLARAAVLTPRPKATVREAAPGGDTDLETAEYAIASASRSTVVYVLPPGPKTIRSLEITPRAGTAGAWLSARLRLTWEDDDPDPTLAGVDLPLGLAFGRARGLPAVESRAIGSAGSAWLNRFPMPYRSRALLRIDTDLPLQGNVRVRTTRGPDAGSAYFHAAVVTGPGRLDGTGRGHIIGSFAFSNGPRLMGSRLVVDGKTVGPLSTALGTVENPPGTSLWQGEVVAGPEAGPAGARGAYRWRVADPIAFDHSFSIEAEAGSDTGRVAPEVTQTAVLWYSDHPRPRRGVR